MNSSIFQLTFTIIVYLFSVLLDTIFKNVVIIRFVSPETDFAAELLVLVVFVFGTMSCFSSMKGAHKCSFIDSKCLGDKNHLAPTFGKIGRYCSCIAVKGIIRS